MVKRVYVPLPDKEVKDNCNSLYSSTESVY